MRAAFVFPIAAGVGGGELLYRFFKLVVEYSITGWQVFGLLVAGMATIGLLIDWLSRRAGSSE